MAPPQINTLRIWIDLVLGKASSADHGQRRSVRLIQSAASALIGRGLGMAVSLITVPLTISYLGTERFGLWMTISSILAWVQLADLGLGNGLTNALSRTYGTERPDLAQIYVATTFWVLTAIGAGLAVLALAVGAMVDWPSLFRVESATTAIELSTAVTAAMLLTCIGLPLGVIEKIYGAYQEGPIASVWAAVGSLASLGALIVVSVLRGGLVELVIAFAGSQLLVKAVSAAWLFGWHKPWIAPSPSRFARRELRILMVVGGEFLALQLAVLFLFQSDNLVIAHYLGGSAVAEYNVVYQLFAQVLAIQGLLLAPLWPAYGEALARNDLSWIRQTFRRSLAGHMLCFGLGLVVLCSIARPLIYYWTGRQITPDLLLIILMGVWTLMAVWGNVFAYLLNGLGIVRSQAFSALILAAINFGLSILWVQQIGSLGVILATIVAYALTSFWIAPLLVVNKLKQLDR